MSKYSKIQNGFGAVELILILVVVGVVGFVGWRVMHTSKPVQTAQQSKTATTSVKDQKAQEITSKIVSASTASTTPATAAADDQVATPAQSTDISYTSKYEGFSFSYPNDWSKTVFSDDATSTGITVGSSGRGVLVSFGSPVIAPTSNCTSSSTKLEILAVQPTGDIGANRTTYIIDYTDGNSKAIALTDWEGSAPKVGVTDKCAYQPTFVSKKTGSNVWFKISGISDANLNLSATDFFKLPEVIAARKIITSGKY